MRVLVVANLTPFLRGGADAHIQGLTTACREAGFDVECLRLPFAFSPPDEVRRAMSTAGSLELGAPSGQSIDILISLQFPAYGVAHPNHRVWVMHQHRAVYDLFDAKTSGEAMTSLRTDIQLFDQKHLGAASYENRLFANSRTVAQRLARFNGLQAAPVYHPPPDHQHFFTKAAQDYVFYPSRFESLKRQLLLIEAAKFIRSPITLVLAGEGGQAIAARRRIEALRVRDRVRLLGAISTSEKIVWYAHALAVCYPTQDEDYGYVALESMCAGKPTIICQDGGGPTEFIKHNETGLVVAPEPQAIAEAIDSLYANRVRAAEMGSAARSSWDRQGITWPSVLETLMK
jgi:glycosyltransferase involved in cell wall biosynthesis